MSALFIAFGLAKAKPMSFLSSWMSLAEMGCGCRYCGVWRPGWLTWAMIRLPSRLDSSASFLKASNRSPEKGDPRGMMASPAASS